MMLQEVSGALEKRLESFHELANINGDRVISGGLSPEFFASGIRDDCFWQEELTRRLREIADEKLARELFEAEERRVDGKDTSYANELAELACEFERVTRKKDNVARAEKDAKIARRLQLEFDKENASSANRGMIDDIIVKVAKSKKSARIGFFKRILRSMNGNKK